MNRKIIKTVKGKYKLLNDFVRINFETIDKKGLWVTVRNLFTNEFYFSTSCFVNYEMDYNLKWLKQDMENFFLENDNLIIKN